MSMLIGADLNKTFRRTFWTEAMMTTLFLGDIFSTSRSTKESGVHELFHKI